MNQFLEKQELSEESVEQKKKFEELLKKQEIERQQQKEQKKINDEQFKDPKERMLNIQKEFKQKMDDMNKLIQQFDKKTGSVEDLFTPFNEMKNYFIDTNYALTTFDKQLYKEQIEKMEKTLFSVKDLLKPREKFQFSKRKKQQAPQENNAQNEKNQLIVDSNNEDTFIKTICGFDSLQDQKLVPGRDELKNTYKLTNLKNCEVYLNGKFETVYINNLENCKIFIGPAKSSVFVDKCKNCELQLSGHQLRIHNSYEIIFKIFTPTKCIIEHCSKLVFSPYDYTYPEFQQDFKDSGYSEKQNLWRDVQDFNWLKQEKSPNFVLKEN